MTTRHIISIFLFCFIYINALPIESNSTISTSFTVKEKETITLKCPSSTSDSNTDSLMLYDNESIDDEELESRKRRDDSFLIVQWYKDTTRINKLTSSSRYKLLNNNNDLKIKNVNQNDAGLFKCKQINGFGGSVTHSLNLIIELSNSTTTTSRSNMATKQAMNKLESPQFIDKTQQRLFRKQKGTDVKLKCRATAVLKPEIMWFKNGDVLTEEEYGITRSKWTLDLKDLRMSDNGNFTCQVFNKYGYINATFEIIVYEETQVFESLDPLNATIIAGMDAVFNCKIKSANLPNIKWMKQISKTEYSNYVQQNNVPHLNSNDDILKNFYQQLTTQAPYAEPSDKNIFSINDLLSPNSNEEDSDDLKLFSLNKEVQTHKREQKIESDESVHYITLTSSPLIDQQTTFNSKENLYISKLTIKQASVKDTGVYVCFSTSLQGSNTRKSFLRVVPSQYSSLAVDELHDQLSKLMNTKESKEEQTNYQSIGILIVLIPVLLITSFSIISICYLKQFNQKQGARKKSVLTVFKSIANCCCKSEANEFERKKSKFSFSSSSVRTSSSSENGTTKSSLGSSLSTDSSSTTATTVAYYTTIPLLNDKLIDKCNQSPPKLPNSQPPSFQTPHLNDDKLLERCTSTPSMAYYKVVDNDMIGGDTLRRPLNNINEFNDTDTCVSTNSRLYYQLTPMPVVHHYNYR